MGKYTIEFKRTVRVREYETLTIGYIEEFESTTDVRTDAYDWCKELVNDWIEEELKHLRSGDTS